MLGRVACLALLLLALPPGQPARGAENPYAALPFERIQVRIEGRDYVFEHRAYPEPLALDLTRASGAQSSPFETLLSFHGVLLNIVAYDEIVPYGRNANGEVDPPPADIPRYIQSARKLLSEGRVLILGEIRYDGYTIYIYRLTASIKHNLGLPIRAFGERFHVIKDLVLVDRLANRLSANRWNVDALLTKYPPGSEK
jgi:hypothetical protein